MSSPEPQATSPRADDNEQDVNQTSGAETFPMRKDSLKPDLPPNHPEDTPAQNGEAAGSADNMEREKEGKEAHDDTLSEAAQNKESDSPVQPDDEGPAGSMERLSISARRMGDEHFLRVGTGKEYTLMPPQKDEPYLDPTPKTPLAPRSPVEAPAEYTEKDLPAVPAEGDTAGKNGISGKENVKSEESQAEIQNIMEQFADETSSLRQEEIMSPRLELADQFRTAHNHFPPRKSSLDAVKAVDSPSEHPRRSWQSRPASILSRDSRRSLSPPGVPPKSPPVAAGKRPEGESNEHISIPSQSAAPPAPEPEPDQPFDFHRFLEQLRHRTADPVAKFLRSFLNEFGKRQWMVHEQVKIISDFLAFITNKMAQCDVWRGVSDVEFDNAKEGMEKLVMNRLYSQTFSPAIPAPSPSRSRSRSRREMERLNGPGRRGQHQEDVERDDILAQKIRIYGWIKEEHLDIPPLGSNGRRFLALAQQELLKIKGYRAPRDKVICVMNCCKVIFGLLRNSKNTDTSADSFIPLLIYVVLKANPEHLISNIQYILRFRNQDKLGGEAGYYLSSLSGATQFIETLDRTSLTISDEEFEKNVEAAVSAITERNQAESELMEKSLTPRPSHDEPRSRSRESPSSDTDNPAVAGILRTIQKPLTTIGRIFSDDNEPQRERSPSPVQQAPIQHRPPPPSQPQQSRSRPSEEQRAIEQSTAQQVKAYDAQDAAARQASAEAAEARRISRAEHNNVVETLSNMFPNLDKDVIDDVVRVKEGRVGLAVDACLALSAE